jgi:hypothetical protein
MTATRTPTDRADPSDFDGRQPGMRARHRLRHDRDPEPAFGQLGESKGVLASNATWA